MALGDEKDGIEIIKSASSNTFTVIGGLICGPLGAVGGKLVGDSTVTAIDSEINKQFKPHGILNLATSVNASKNIDEVFSGFAAYFSKTGESRSTSVSGALCSAKNNIIIIIIE